MRKKRLRLTVGPFFHKTGNDTIRPLAWTMLFQDKEWRNVGNTIWKSADGRVDGHHREFDISRRQGNHRVYRRQ
ncbi:hypothetical protein D3C81_2214240 [compost metagenome]